MHTTLSKLLSTLDLNCDLVAYKQRSANGVPPLLLAKVALVSAEPSPGDPLVMMLPGAKRGEGAAVLFIGAAEGYNLAASMDVGCASLSKGLYSDHRTL